MALWFPRIWALPSFASRNLLWGDARKQPPDGYEEWGLLVAQIEPSRSQNGFSDLNMIKICLNYTLLFESENHCRRFWDFNLQCQGLHSTPGHDDSPTIPRFKKIEEVATQRFVRLSKTYLDKRSTVLQARKWKCQGTRKDSSNMGRHELQMYPNGKKSPAREVPKFSYWESQRPSCLLILLAPPRLKKRA